MNSPSEPNPTVTGRWYIVRTSLPLWRRWQNPSVTYNPLPDGRILDVVFGTSGGQKPRLVLGVDRVQPDGSYRWRGLTPLTRLTSSRWRVVHAEQDWALTHFEKTLFTPEGIDVYARAPRLAADMDEHVAGAIAASKLAAPFADALFEPVHDAAPE